MDAQDIRNIREAYLGVYQELDEGSGVVTGTAKAINTVLGPARQTPQQRDVAVGNITRGLNVVAEPIKSVLSVGPEKNKEMMQKRRPLNQDVDLFDLIKGHLMSEGYADTEESALVIMANMSEEWRQSIVEQTARIDYVQDKFNRENSAKSGSALTAIPGKQNTGQALQKAKQSAAQMGKLEGV
jgi:hypothetical protein